jgi:HAD superfamily hydrolase (TIGR01484 family)
LILESLCYTFGVTKYKAIISDIDNTLAPLSMYSIISGKVKAAIAELNKRQFIFSLATGKPFSLVEHLIDELNLTSPIIVDNGAAIFDAVKKRPIWISYINPYDCKIIHSILKKYKYHVRISDGNGSMDMLGNLPTGYRTTKFVIMDLTIPEAEFLITEVESMLKSVTLVKTSAHKGKEFTDVYITNAGATKQNSVIKFSELMKIKPDEIIGIGDHYNDFPLLMACGLKVAVGNAVPELKEIADYIAPSVEEDGVADVIEKFVLNT